MYTNVKAELSLHAINTRFSTDQSSQKTELAEVGKSLIGIVSSETYKKKHYYSIFINTKYIMNIEHTGVYKYASFFVSTTTHLIPS